LGRHRRLFKGTKWRTESIFCMEAMRWALGIGLFHRVTPRGPATTMTNTTAPDHPLASRFIDAATLPWSKTELPGSDMKLPYKDEALGRSTILFRMQPGAVMPLYEHTHDEQAYMLDGSLVDEQGACSAGQFVWRPAGNTHVAHAPNGAVFLSVFLKPNTFLDLQPGYAKT
jgi:quercetin dioxygenase-like cupin family protein